MDRNHNIGDEEFEYFVLALSDRLRNLRDKTGESQEAIAHKSGLACYTYQKFEKGESRPGVAMNPRLDTLLSLSKTYGIDISELLDFRKSREGN